MQIAIGICQPYIFLFLITISNWIYFSLASSLHPPSALWFPYGAREPGQEDRWLHQLSVFYWLLQTTLVNWFPWPLTSLFLVSETESFTDEAKAEKIANIWMRRWLRLLQRNLCIVFSVAYLISKPSLIWLKILKEAGDFKIKKRNFFVFRKGKNCYYIKVFYFENEFISTFMYKL